MPVLLVVLASRWAEHCSSSFPKPIAHPILVHNLQAPVGLEVVAN